MGEILEQITIEKFDILVGLQVDKFSLLWKAMLEIALEEEVEYGWRTMNVIPLCKKGSRDKPGKYKPGCNVSGRKVIGGKN